MNLKKYIVMSYVMLLSCYYAWLISMGSDWRSVEYWITWGINILGLLAIVNVFIKNIYFNINIWRIVFFLMVLVQVYQLYSVSLFPQGAEIGQMLFTLIQYAFLVVPSLIALYISAVKKPIDI